MVRTPGGHNKLELTKFQTRPPARPRPNAPANSLGLCRVMIAGEDVDETVSGCELRASTSSARWSVRTPLSALLRPRPLGRRRRIGPTAPGRRVGHYTP